MVQRRLCPSLFLVAAAGLLQALAGPATLSVSAEPPTLNELNLEVDVLLSLVQFQFTPEQVKTLHKLAPETASDLGVRQAPKASERYRKTLQALHGALLKATDLDQVNELNGKLEELTAAEKPELDTAFEITAEARKRAPEVLRILSARQLAGYIGLYGEEFPDPKERLLQALGKVRGLEPKDWKDLREQLAEEVGRLVAGLDLEKAASVGDKVVQWLIEVRSLSDAEFKLQRPELEKKVDQLLGKLHPLDVVRHHVEFALAELLSNPRLEAALAARLKAGK